MMNRSHQDCSTHLEPGSERGLYGGVALSHNYGGALGGKFACSEKSALEMCQ